ncbi:MAG: DegT/DnrJ/EryC1/StrS family aminotransferase, partial [bacterium]
MSIPFVDLEAQFKGLEEEIHAGINRVLNHGKYIMGPEVQELESELAAFAEVKHVITCSSGTDALLMPLMALGIGPGDAVFTTPFTFIASAEVIALLGATPVFVDIDKRTFNIGPEMLDAAIMSVKEAGHLQAKAIMAVDLFGLPAPYDAIMPIAEKHDLYVIEDAAQSFGAEYQGKKAGGLAHIAGTSFFPAKPLGCYGDGGAILTNDDRFVEELKSIRIHGKGSDKYDNVRIGLNARLDTLQAAILLPKLKAFPYELKRRQHIAMRYTEGLGHHVTTPLVPKGIASAWAQYSILSDHRDDIQTALKKRGIPSAIYYPK